MATALTGVTQSQPVAPAEVQTTPTTKSGNTGHKVTQSQSNTAAPTDTVQISNAARVALQETTETRAQTVQEAQKGDRQAQRLLTKEAAAEKV